jgi:hypothetical protein
MNSKAAKTALSDRPVSCITDDSLKNNRYATALANFIQSAETPITIGIQGGWGTGKTSLLNLLKSKFEEPKKSNPDQPTQCLVVLVNAWEHSLFSSTDSAGVAIGLLQGLIDELLDTIDALPNVPQEVKKELLGRKLDLQKLTKKVGLAALGAATYAAKTALATFHIHTPPEESHEDGGDPQPSMAKRVKQLREEIKKTSEEIQKALGFDRIVFFIDDLDRVQPQTAVEILDALKNIFDVENAVFVLAIDYDVVINGLSSKFGTRDKSNEREFRQYFDKIIQVPFSMPVSAYRSSFDNYMDQLLRRLGIEDMDGLNEMTNVAWLTSLGVPRSVKRIVNTMSLLTLFEQDGREDAPIDSEHDKEYLRILFKLVCIQIGFPSIYAKITERPKIEEWSIEFLEKSWQLQITEDFEEARRNGLSEPWQQVVFLLAMKDPWLASRTSDLIEIIASLLSDLNQVEDQKRAGFLGALLDAVSITSVGTATTTTTSNSVRNDEVTEFCRNLHRSLIVNKLASGDPSLIYAKQIKGGRSYKFSIANTLVSSGQIDLLRAKGKQWHIVMWVQVNDAGKNSKKLREHLAAITRGSTISDLDLNSLRFCKRYPDVISIATQNSLDKYVEIYQDLYTRVKNKAREFDPQ